MRFQADRDVFSEAVSFVVKLLPQRTTLPILSGVLIEVSSGGLTLSAFDYEVSAQTTATVDVHEDGRVLVSGKLLAVIAEKLPNESLEVWTEDSTVNIQSGAAHFTLQSMPLEEYPTIPQVEEQTGVVRAEDFAEAVSQIVIAASREDASPVITSVKLMVTGNTVSLTASDRYRVAVRKMVWDGGLSGDAADADSRVALIPARTLAEIGKTFGTSGTISIALTKKDDRELIAFTGGSKTVTSLLISGNFPPVERLFPETVENYAVVGTSELRDAARRVSLVIDKEAPLRFTFGEKSLALESIGSETATASETIDAVLHGPEMTVSLRPGFVVDGLNAVGSEFVRLAFVPSDRQNKPGPVLITAQGSKEDLDEHSYKYLLQPNLLLR